MCRRSYATTMDSRYLEEKLHKGESVCGMQIVLADIFGYSTRRAHAQVPTILALTECFKRATGQTASTYTEEMSLIEAHVQRDIVVLPTGAGLAAAFPFGLPGISLAFVDALVSAVCEHNASQEPCTTFAENGFCDCHTHMLLRVGVSEGPTVLYRDFNDRLNIAGNPVTLATKVTELSEPGQVFLSDAAHRTLVEHVPGREGQFRPYYQAEIGDGARIDVHQYTNKGINGLDVTPTAGLGLMETEALPDIVDIAVTLEPSPAPPRTNRGVQRVAGRESISQSAGNEYMVLMADEHFTMGSDGSGRVEVLFTRPFLIGTHLVTQDEYESVTGRNPSRFTGASRPVEMVSWFDAVQFCNTLSVSERLNPVYEIDGSEITADHTGAGYRLPTEAEWELCCRGAESNDERYGVLDKIAWYGGNADRHTHPVGELEPRNGISDLLGNVWEWCEDWFQRGHPTDPQIDYVGPADGRRRVLRGGSWRDLASCITANYRHHAVPGKRDSTIGFRIARTAVNQPSE
jgi:sulfatase modifying factor 1